MARPSSRRQVTALDNFDFYESSGVPSKCRDAEQALSVAKGILERSLSHEHAQAKDPTSAAELFDRWDSFGDYPSIYPELDPPFNPSEYAQQRAAEICATWQVTLDLGGLGLTGCVTARILLESPKYGGRVLDWGSSGARMNKARIVDFFG